MTEEEARRIVRESLNAPCVPEPPALMSPRDYEGLRVWGAGSFRLDPPLGKVCATEPHYSKSELKNRR